jgi:NAD(P)-dependent dehydrogenase (short-subunit alcohol dehydrogenase family)
VTDSPRIALVTGAGSGIGRSAAINLAAAGWTVVLTGRHEQTLGATAELSSGPDPLVLPTDVTDEAAVERVFGEIRDRWGRLDLVFNNAGMGAPAVPVDELTAQQWRAVVDVNLTGSFLVAQAAFALMRDQRPQGGRIINNGSLSAHTPRPFSAPYTATKHAITGLTKALALDGRAHRIACGQLDIGNAATDLTARMSQGVPQADGSVAVEPVMDVAHVGRTIAFLASLPLDVNVPTMTIMANEMPYVGRG